MTRSTSTARHRFDAAPLYKALFLTLVAAFVAVPLLATVLGGFKSLGELRTNPFGLPQSWEWENYWGILSSQRYWVLLRNSLIIASLSTFLTLTVASMAGFVFAHETQSSVARKPLENRAFIGASRSACDEESYRSTARPPTRGGPGS